MQSLPKLRDHHCIQIARDCPQLQTIDLTGSNEITDAGNAFSLFFSKNIL